MKWLVVLSLFPHLLSAQFLLDQQQLEWVENADTIALNTIAPTTLWRNFHVPKSAVFSLIEYRNSMGYIDHYDELYTLAHWDSTLVNFLQEQLPLNLPKTVRKTKVKSYARFSPSRWTLQSSLNFKTESFNAIIHRRITESGTQSPTTVAHKYHIGRGAQLYALVGAHKITAGQGLVLGASSFPSLASSEVFSRGIQPKTGAGNYAHEGTGAALQLAAKGVHLNYSFTREHSHRGALSYKHPRGVLGIATDTTDRSMYYKLHYKNVRWFGEHTLNKHAIGCNLFVSDVLFEYLTFWEQGALSTRFHMSWRDRSGSYFIKREQQKLKAVYQGKQLGIFVSQHLDENVSSFRWRIQAVLSRNRTLEIHYHEGTRGIALREKWNRSRWSIEGALALIEYEEHPVWISHPIASGNIGATGIFKDYAGLHIRATYKSLDLSAHWNALAPSEPQLKLSSTLSL
jgi:hypothetical protein